MATYQPVDNQSGTSGEATPRSVVAQEGSKVQFIGPVYEHTHGPFIGDRGVIFEKAGHYSQLPGQDKEELVTVSFVGHKKMAVVHLNRLKVLE